jgi:hypothetical protein
MKIETLPNGNLAMSCNNEEQIEIAQLYLESQSSAQAKETSFILGYVLAKGFPYRVATKGERAGCLTEACIITDGKDIWGDMSYETKNFLETLAAEGVVIWTKGQ